MFLDGLDELDQKIVQLLIKNARMSYSDIGQKNWNLKSGCKNESTSIRKKRYYRRIYNNY